MLKPITIDFETEAIQDRPHYPPKPVGVSIKYPGKAPKYWAWGHPVENNCTKDRAVAELMAAYKAKNPILFHNAKFDLDVAREHCNLPVPDWRKWHDTMFLLFLHDPHAKTLDLKPSAEKLLGLPPEERDAVQDWVLANVPGAKKSDWGAHISRAPGALVGKYANGDVVRTEQLFLKLYPEIIERGMGNAYDRERRVMPILLENERVGIRLDVDALRADLKAWHTAVKKAEQWLFKQFGYEFNLDSDEQKATALERSGIVTEWALTATGKRSTSKKNMTVDRFNNPQVAQVLGYRDRLCTCIRMFGENWLAMAEAGDGYVHTTWNQVRQGDEKNKVGTRTGRPSTTNPNFLNVSKAWGDKDDGYVHPTVIKLPPLPLMRRYLLPDKGDQWLHRDYNQQELRMAAHFEDDALLKLYNTPITKLPPEYVKDGKLDVHNFVSKEIARLRGLEIARGPAKITVFRKLYGGGIPATAASLKCSADEARAIIAAVEAALPGIKSLEKSVKAIGKSGQPIVTWGGREYYTEPPAYSKKYKRDMTFEYKLLNYLIQGSSADATKEAMIRYDAAKREGRFLVAVYDESNISAPPKAAKREMKILKDCMESIEVDLPMLTDGKWGPNWGSLEKYND